ncbi:glycosyltransferase family 2 protein [Sphingomonas sp. RRHST34]|uniref:Glycosyltransferase family 2 protein n=1 Tax=Sphingomonas citri TaxID=2862499 RepID=A0ABS7BPW2_9SPHN|nr:glycosyltransferase family 2 protein [Sphingomonas citri]MBW6531646.1 glycosyltransferase family 2 protein [Sphingomonas citri]
MDRPTLHEAAPPAAPARVLPAELAIVVPVYNESRNVPLLVAALDAALTGVRWEVVFVDDNSPDRTADQARDLALADPRVRVVQRFGRRGLSTACIEGILATAAPYVAVMDGDMQHDERVLTDMFRRITRGDVDVVVGSRYVAGGGVGEWDRRRAAMSRFATRLAGRLTRAPITDPMSGFFMLRRDAFMAALPNLSTVGFKILLDIAASTPEPLRVAEVPYTFRTRQHGESKLDSLVLWEYLQLLLDKMFGRYVPVRFISFAMVGGSGVFVHFLVLTIVLESLLTFGDGAAHQGRSFAIAQGAATLVATTSNFLLNNLLTYRDQRLTGRRLWWGWLSFNLVCGIGFLANVGIAHYLYQRQNYLIVSALAGIAVTTVWNYAMSSIFTWRKRG